MINLYLFRHGQSEANLNAEIIAGGNIDTPLSHLGKRQAYALKDRLYREGIRFDEVWSSDLVRAVSTAEIAGVSNSHVPLFIDKRLRELYQGDFVGKNRKETYAVYRSAMDLDPWGFAPPNGQSQAEKAKEMVDWGNEKILKKGNDEKTFGIFGHGVSFKCWLAKTLGIDKRIAWRIELDNTSITQLKYDGRWKFVRLNDAAHIIGLL